MIERYSDQAANERTLLAWLRTGLAIVAFGFLIEKFKLFAATAAKAANLDEPLRLELEKFSGSFSQGAGRWLTVLGIGSMAIATVRFVRTARLLDDQKYTRLGCSPTQRSRPYSLVFLRRSASISCSDDPRGRG